MLRLSWTCSNDPHVCVADTVTTPVESRLVDTAGSTRRFAMGITTFEELTAWARTHCPEEHARLPDLAIYDITRRNGRSMSICVGSIARTVIYRDLISFEDNSLKVHVHLDPNSGALILLAGDNIRLTRSYHDKIQLSEPYCWLWPNLSDSLGLAKFDALVRYALMAQGYDGRLETMSFGIHEVFPQLCSDIARGQDVQNMKSIWEGGRRYDQDLEDDDSEDAHGNGSEGSELAEDFPEEQQNTSVAVWPCFASLFFPL